MLWRGVRVACSVREIRRWFLADDIYVLSLIYNVVVDKGFLEHGLCAWLAVLPTFCLSYSNWFHCLACISLYRVYIYIYGLSLAERFTLWWFSKDSLLISVLVTCFIGRDYGNDVNIQISLSNCEDWALYLYTSITLKSCNIFLY